jgi:urea carboxylase
VAVSKQSAIEELGLREKEITALQPEKSVLSPIGEYAPEITLCRMGEHDVAIRRSGDSWLLIEFGEMVLDIELRFQAHRLMLALQNAAIPGLKELTPGIRSLQVHYDALAIAESQLIGRIAELLEHIAGIEDKPVPSRIIHLPLSWDDEQCKLAIERYHQVVRKDAPWYPSNIEFIRRINGLESTDEVKRIVFDASYLVMGLGDVYLGAPVATPMDPRHRLVTTKYNPARTWTAENSVGIGGSYLCIYGMEGPGGYQFVGRTLQMWNRYRQTKEFSKPWLLRFFDQIRFYPVDDQELVRIRQTFPIGDYPIEIEETQFSLSEYKAFLAQHAEQISLFKGQQQQAFDEELANWRRDGQFHFEEKPVELDTGGETIPEGVAVVESPVAGSVWKLEVDEGSEVEEGDTLLVLESMKMEIVVSAPCVGRVVKALKVAGSSVQSGTPLVFIEERP